MLAEGKLEKALTKFKEYIKLEPLNPLAHY